MVFSVHKNFTTNVKSRPPLIVFTVCLLGIIITSVCLAYYVHSGDKIVNVDAINDWISLLKYMNKLELCTSVGDKSQFQMKMQRDASSVRVATPAKLLKLPPNSPHRFQGLIPLADWSSKCLERTDVPSHLKVEFSVPQQNDTEEICVTITGPADFMPKLSVQDPCKSPEPVGTRNKNKWGLLKANTKDVPVDTFCDEELLLQLQYDIDYNQNLKYEMYLSDEDRLMINSHLIVTSCFLVFVVVLITCYALVRKTSSSISESKQHLMSKGMYL
ncbi:hypothetical protein PPYR_03542 [Photinus pyralis]|uniref:TMEM248/TMEM219 domain-containing protein n=1 Tax=Photinus pyralis TaxID=7054 RepID=A0A1Y1N076_PHOPY|nr:transmembrane protein 248-like [Photinus pyralis]KAB0791742.1 hypothetical protein PPYR_03542 [Photinus pyralis]